MLKYQEVMEYLSKEYIENPLWKVELPMPSIRFLTEKMGCSKNTVIKAYEELEQKHLVYSIPQSGYYVLLNSGIEVHSESVDVIDFVHSNPDQRALPYKEFIHCVSKVGEKYDQSMLWYPNPSGAEGLKKEIDKLLAGRQIYSSTECLCITNGEQEAINILLSMPWKNANKGILTEVPGYSPVREMAKVYGWEMFYIERTEDGINLSQLRSMFQSGRIKLFYLMPRYQNPTGLSLSAEQKRKIAELAAAYEVYVIEDDYLAELDPKAGNLPITYYDVGERLIYLVGFSKSFMPGLRIGAVRLPKMLVAAFIEWKRVTTLGTTMLDQSALEIFLQHGMYEKHRKKLIKIYKDKMNWFRICWERKIASEKRLQKKVKIDIPDSGYYIRIQFDKSIHSRIICSLLEQQGVLVSDGDSFWPEENPEKEESAIRICISSCSEAEIEKGIEIIVKVACKII